jgi:copper transport protein
VPWPAQPGDHTLAAVTAALRAAGQITIYEQVTSDTSRPAQAPYRLDLTGGFFLAQEPYATGVAPIAVRISRPGQPLQLGDC